jgi:hypothetical protein
LDKRTKVQQLAPWHFKLVDTHCIICANKRVDFLIGDIVRLAHPTALQSTTPIAHHVI